MKRSWSIWLAFLVSLGVVFAAMGWLSLTILRLDQAEANARQQAALEENVRLALWRMDSALAPLVAKESVRPYFSYGTFLPLDRAWGRMFHPGRRGELLVPSPLLQETSPEILVHFQIEPDGQLTSPQSPADNVYALAVPKYLSEDRSRLARERLKDLATYLKRSSLLARLPAHTPALTEVVLSPMGLGVEPSQAMAQRPRSSMSRGAMEYQIRNQAVAQNANVMAQSQGIAPLADAPPSTELGGVLMTPLWIDRHLILARRIAVDGKEYVQGCLLDWPAIRTGLRESVADLLPTANLEPIREVLPEKEARTLAALPLRLMPGTIPLEPRPGLSPIRLTLWIAWGCVLLAALAAAILLGGVIRLSQRRAAFVSAVTHELRTPLTTFHIYTEMLSEGMVPEQETQRQYLDTLRTEASRLSHLVENVLAYARLERGRPTGRLEQVTLGKLIAATERRLGDRARQAGMQLLVEGDDDALATSVRANPSAVEQILFNLVDNACKYASLAVDRRIHLRAEHVDGAGRLCVRDHGPGIPRASSRRLFRSFTKSAHEAANTAPGVGLGLALSRRLASDMGGRLDLDGSVAEGACFVVRLAAGDSG